MTITPQDVSDWTPVLIPVFSVLGLGIAGWAVRMGNLAVAAFERRTGVQLAAHQLQMTQNANAVVMQTARTAAGIVQTLINQRRLPIADVDPENQAIKDIAKAAIDRVPENAAIMKKTPESMAQTIVGLVDTAPPPPPVILVPPAGPPVAA
jgi:hypothetical protein